MSSQKRHEQAVNSEQARKRSRLLASSAGGPSGAEPTDPGESEPFFFELAVEEIEFTDEYFGPEPTNCFVVNEQRPHVSGEVRNSPELPTRDNEEEPGNDDGSRPERHPPHVVWVDENTQQWEQNELSPPVSGPPENSPELPTRDNEEEPGNDDGSRPECHPPPLVQADENNPQWEQNELYPLVSGPPENSPVQWTRDSEEELSSDNYTVSSSPYSSDENSQQWEQNELCPLVSGLPEQLPVQLTRHNEQEPDSEEALQPTIKCPICMDFYSKITNSERVFLVTRCGHIFCSECLPTAIEVCSTCPTCRTELTQENYHRVYV